jgi:DNA replication protein DnaC
MYKKFTPCRKCIKLKKDDKIPQGFYYDTLERNGETYSVVKECDCHKKWKTTEDLYKVYKKNGFRPEHFDYDVSTYLGTKSKNNLIRFNNYIEKINDSAVNSTVLYFYGTNGTQKTTIAHWLGKELLKKNIDVMFTDMRTLVDCIYNSGGNNFDEELRDKCRLEFSRFISCGILIIDESFSKDKISTIWNSDYQIGNLGNFIRERIGHGKGIIFISNDSLDELETQKFNKSIIDLIRRETVKRNSAFEFKDSWRDTVNENNLDSVNLFTKETF